MVENIIEGIQLGLKNSILGLLRWTLGGIAANSFWICLFISMAALILYVGGIKKAGRYCTASFVVYVFLQAIGSVLK